MASVLRMPGVSADSTAAALLEWSVTPGAAFKRGEPIALIETDKASVELEAEEDAVLLRTLAEPGQTVPVGDPIAVLVKPGEQVADEAAVLAELGLDVGSSGGASADTAPPAAFVLEPVAAAVPGRTAAANGAGATHGRIFASPLARRLAAAAGLRLEDIPGTGPGGRVTRRDVEATANGTIRKAASVAAAPVAAPAPVDTAAPAPVVAVPTALEPVLQAAKSATVAAASGTGAAGFTDVPHSKMRRAIAGALTSSKQQVPHFYLRATCRVDALLDLRTQVNAAGSVKLSVNDFVVKAAGRALVDVPDMNVVWTPDAVRRFDSADVSVAVSTERGLVTPVVRGVDRRTITDISASIKDYAARAAAGTLKQSDLEGGSLTISNLGMYGVEEFVAIINPPQSGILAVGSAVELPTKGADGSVEFGRFVTVVLSVDHRPVDGVVAARWLDRFTTLVENPLLLLV